MIFSGIEFLFFFLGLFAAIAVFVLTKLHRAFQFDWRSWSLAGVGIFLALFAVAWSVSSILEGEPRAASMGMVFFGLPAVVMLTLQWRLLTKKTRHLV